MTERAESFTPAESIPYASTMVHARPPSAWAGAAIIFGGLGLVLLGGCFLIGVMMIVSPVVQPTTSITLPQTILMFCLYLLAFACFAGAVVMLFVGTRSLLRLLRA